MPQRRNWWTTTPSANAHRASLPSTYGCTFIGQKRKGIAGGILATLGIVFPSLVIISILAGLITNFSDLVWVQNAFAGIQVCVCVLIFNAVIKLLKKSVIDKRTCVIFLLVMTGGTLLSLSPVWFVLLAALAGIVLKNLEEALQNDLSPAFLGVLQNRPVRRRRRHAATLPFLKNIGLSTGWYSQTALMNMLAVSESTPGPIGINIATYVGFTVCSVPGAVIATVGGSALHHCDPDRGGRAGQIPGEQTGVQCTVRPAARFPPA